MREVCHGTKGDKTKVTGPVLTQAMTARSRFETADFISIRNCECESVTVKVTATLGFSPLSARAALVIYSVFLYQLHNTSFNFQVAKYHKRNMPAIKPNLPIIWVLGGPGSGKGTQCDRIVQKYGFTHISTGDLLRDEVASGSERGRELSSIMKEGKLVPNDVVLSLLKEKVLKELPSTKGILIDGYPREKAQGEAFEKEIAEVNLVLYFEAADETMTQRLLKRAETSGRSDDNIETIKKRLTTFHQNNDPIIEQYKAKTKTISAEQLPDKIFEEVVKYIDALKS